MHLAALARKVELHFASCRGSMQPTVSSGWPIMDFFCVKCQDAPWAIISLSFSPARSWLRQVEQQCDPMLSAPCTLKHYLECIRESKMLEGLYWARACVLVW